MRAAEILRRLADIVDVTEPQPAAQQPIVINVGGTGETSNIEPDASAELPKDVMIPPLQQKIELMKHQAGVDSVYDEEPEGEDEMAVLKRNAGIAVTQQADEDEPFEG